MLTRLQCLSYARHSSIRVHMQLIAASKILSNDLRYMVRSVSVVKIYYVWTGRNAWWSTWSTHYSEGCMHSTFESAKSFCEARRTQGTVFYIDELPSLAFRAPEGALIVSEINTKQFLANFDFDRLTSITTVFPVSTMTLQQMFYAFNASSPLWPENYPRYNSRVFFASGADSLEDIQPTVELTSYSSSSSGPNYPLGWTRRKFEKDRTLLHQISSALSSRLNKP